MKRLVLAISLVFLAAVAQAQMDVPSQGWDGALDITANTVIDLSRAMPSTAWDLKPADYVAGSGIYDQQKWAVVFHYTSVTIAAGATLSFTNHPANPPVVWLVEGAVQVNGTLTIAGATNGTNGERPGGPGGFQGGRYGYLPALSGAGFGPGGGSAGISNNDNAGRGGGYATAGASGGGTTYGNPAVIPLLGGSGGGGRYNIAEGGASGGGAILIGAQTSVTVNGGIDARGGSSYYAGAGSGGAIRLITPVISGTGVLTAVGGYATSGYSGGAGRIRIEANTQNFGSLNITPPASVIDPGVAPQFWQDSTTPTVRVVSLNGVAVPTDPHGSLAYPSQDAYLSGAGDVTAILEATNVPTNSTIQVFITKQGGLRTLLPTGSVTFTGGNTTLSTWQAVFPSVPNGMFAVQARAVLP